MEAATATATEATTSPVPQHMAALAHANRVRLARAQLKRDIHAGKIKVQDVLERVPWMAETMPVAELFRAQVRWGRTRVRKFLSYRAISENRELSRLSHRQRAVLIADLNNKG